MIDRLRELLRAATPGPWRIGFSDGSGRDSIIAPETRRGTRLTERTVIRGGQDGWGVPLGVEEMEDARLIVELRNHAAELLDAHDRMAGALAKAERLNAMLPDELTRLADLLEAKVPVPSNRTDYFEGWLDAVHAVQAELRSLRAALAVPKEENPDV